MNSTTKRGFSAIAAIFLFLLIFPLSASGGQEEENLLYNGDFELLDDEGLPEGWFSDAYIMDTGYSVFRVTKDGESGSRAATVQNAAENDARFAQVVSVQPGNLYCLSGYIRAENITGGHGANLSVEGVYAFSEKIYDTDGDWKYIEYYGETGPGQNSITVFARIGGYSGESKGTASFDNLCLKQVEGLPAGVIPDLWYTETEFYDEEDTEDLHRTVSAFWPALLAIGIFYTAAVFMLLYSFRDGKRITRIPAFTAKSSAVLPILFLALCARLLLSYFVKGYSVDVSCFTSWGHTMSIFGPAQFYHNSGFCDYPPLYTYVLGFNSWLCGILRANEGMTRVVFRLIPSLCDVAGCWVLLRVPENEYTRNSSYRSAVLLLAFNPVTILNSAAWGQMDSVLCLLLLCVAVFAVKGKWIPAVLLYVTAILVKPQALMLGLLGLVFMILAVVKERSVLRKILIATGTGIVLILVYILPFGINQQPGWLITQYRNTLTSYPYATLNTANFYYPLGGNWSKIESAAHIAAPLILACGCLLHGYFRWIRNRKERNMAAETAADAVFAGWFFYCAVSGASWTFIGIGAMAYSFVIVITMSVISRENRFLPYLGALLFILLYVFGIKMHERYLFPAFLLLMFAWALHKDRRILYLLLFFSFTVFVNEGIVLDNSIRLGAELGHLNSDTVWIANILSVMNTAGAVYAVWLGYALMRGQHPEDMKTLPGFLPVRTVPAGKDSGYSPDSRLHWTKRDTIILCCITLVYSAVTLTTLGSTKAPQTYWTSSGEDEQIVFDLHEARKDVRILYFAQVSRKDFSVAASNDGMHWTEEKWAQMDQQQCWKWKYVTQSYPGADGTRIYSNEPESIIRFSGRYLRISSQQVGLTLNEIIFRDDQGNAIPAEPVSRSGGNPDSDLWSDPALLLDEQDTMENLPGFLGAAQEGESEPSWWNSTYFDEIYHARTGHEFLHGTVPYETSHPPLGKVFISWFIAVFGMTPFGWRFAGALAGILMLPGIYLLAKQLTKKTAVACFACMLLALDCMHLTQTQIATIDSFPVLFIIFAYFFMLRFIQTDLSACSMRQALIPLAFSGFFMGLSVASKWIGVYAGIGLAVLYFGHCIRQSRIISRTDSTEGTDMFRRFLYLCMWCVLFFVIVPLTIYIVSYIPYLAYNTRIRSISDYLSAVWRSQESMLSYHSTPGLGMDHPFYSPWWQWPIIGKPMYYAAEQYIPAEAALHHSIFSFGNPVVWWGALGALIIAVICFVRTRHYRVEGEIQRWHLTGITYDIRYEFVFVGLLAQYLPWVLVPRGTYIYHYFASIPFLILITALYFDHGTSITDKRKKMLTAAGIIYLSLALALFIILLPYASGMAAPSWWLDAGKAILRIWY